ncbi:MAG: hypothetical protein ACXWUG_03045 [Polyangiales bacterium]
MVTKILVKGFDDPATAEHAVHALHDAGIARDDLGYIGAGLGDLDELLVGRASFEGPFVLAGPPVAARTITLVDTLVRLGVSRVEAMRHVDELQHGGAVVTVTVDDEEEEALARSLL